MNQERDEHAVLEEIREFYDDEYYGRLPTRLETSRHHRALARRLGIDVGQEVLDVACGTGQWLACCAARGARVAGVDLSRRAIAFCTEAHPAGEFVAGPAEHLPFDDARFDVVTCLGSLEHFVDPDGALREMLRVARPDARVLLLVPNADFLTRRLGLFAGTAQTRAKEDVRTLDEWEALFNRNGLEIRSRWKDLHVLSREWILRPPWPMMPLRFAQALALCLWPLRWQYQVYFLCTRA